MRLLNCYFSHPLAIKRGDGKPPTYQLSTSISSGFSRIFLWFCSAINFHLYLIFKYIYIYTYPVGGFNPSEKYESRLGWLFPIYGKLKHVPKHQPDMYTDIPIGRPEGHPDSWKRWNMGPSSTWPNRHSLASKCCCNRHGMLNHKKLSGNLLGI